ncbi:MAG: glycosyltransferase [Candidatus Aminicenantes bacterium]|nr:glycosyltransferase [Candidatus Aminicenantes bacterium]
MNIIRTKRNKKVAVISYFFSSPDKTGGIRSQKFVKYLPQFGIEPIVITKRRTNPYSFGGRMTPLRTFPVNRPFHLETLTWLPGLVLACLRLIKKEKVHSLLISCGPFSSALVGALLKKLFHVKLILDFRDYWTISPYISKVKLFNRLLNELQKPIEKWILRSADKLIVIQKTMEEQYLERFPFLDGKIKTIFNGFDGEDIPDADCELFQKFTLLYLGNLRRPVDFHLYYPMLFLKSLRKMIDGKLIRESNFQVLIVGEKIRGFEEEVHNLGLSGIVKTLGRVPHEEAINYLRKSHFLLLIVQTQGIMTSKIFEYLATGKPILALIQTGELMDFIQAFSSNSFIVTEPSSQEITRAIRKCFRCYSSKAEQKERRKEFIESFNRKELTRQLAEILHAMQ